jgi:acetyltransferase-like isoleucine patch superfamily enzyme
VFIETGVSNAEAFPIGAVYGIGFEYAIGSGVVVTTGSSMNEFNCLYFFAALGEVMFVGSGIVIGTGSPFIEYVSIISESMQGGAVYIGAGYGSLVGCPFSEWLSIGVIFGAGEYVAVDGESHDIWIQTV